MESDGFWKYLNDLEDSETKKRLIELFEEEHGKSLSLIFTNETQNVRLEELNGELKKEIETRKKQEATLLALTNQLEEKNDELQRLSYIDGLTSVANRRYLDIRIKQEWRRCMRGHLPISLIMIDIDYFKSYNDSYGHLEGDDCLKQVAVALQTSLKRGSDFVARYGGEEFAVVLPCADIEVAKKTAQYLSRQILRLRIENKKSPVHKDLTVSLGVATIQPKVGSNHKSLIDSADKALYEAKANGRNCFILAS